MAIQPFQQERLSMVLSVVETVASLVEADGEPVAGEQGPARRCGRPKRRVPGACAQCAVSGRGLRGNAGLAGPARRRQRSSRKRPEAWVSLRERFVDMAKASMLDPVSTMVLNCLFYGNDNDRKFFASLPLRGGDRGEIIQGHRAGSWKVRPRLSLPWRLRT